MAEIKRTYYDNGELESECFVINGVKNGEYKIYYPYGELVESCNYENGEKIEN
jgi:antitoxin component YwqK of YwqJK toxin-antitoxin module